MSALNLKSRYLPLAVLLIGLGAPLMASAADVPAPSPTTLSLTASGDVSAAPDMATISFGVMTEARTAADAMKANNVRMNAVLAALKAAGIEAKYIQTSSLNLNPQYTYADKVPPTLTGYQAQNQVTVRVNDLAQTGPVIDSVVKAGINQIDSVSFGLKNSDAATDQARQAAVATLTQRANLYASATGMKIKRLVTIEEGSPNSYQPVRPMMAMAKMSANAATPVSAGELQLSVAVSATFELEK